MTNPASVVSLFRLAPMALQSEAEAISRAAHSPTASVQDMGADQGGTDDPLPKKFLSSPDVIAIVQKVDRDGMMDEGSPEEVRASGRGLGTSGPRPLYLHPLRAGRWERRSRLGGGQSDIAGEPC